jgi:hypothetical protein
MTNPDFRYTPEAGLPAVPYNSGRDLHLRKRPALRMPRLRQSANTRTRYHTAGGVRFEPGKLCDRLLEPISARLPRCPLQAILRPVLVSIKAEKTVAASDFGFFDCMAPLVISGIESFIDTTFDARVLGKCEGHQPSIRAAAGNQNSFLCPSHRQTGVIWSH